MGLYTFGIREIWKDNRITEVETSFAGGCVAFVCSDGWIRVHDLKQNITFRVTKGTTPCWLPGDKEILFVRDGKIYFCPVAEDTSDKILIDGRHMGEQVRLSSPRVSAHGIIVLRCQNIWDSKNNKYQDFFYLSELRRGQLSKLVVLEKDKEKKREIECFRGEAVWNREGTALLCETWETAGGRSYIIENVLDQPTLVACFNGSGGNFSPDGERVATFRFKDKKATMVLMEKTKGDWKDRELDIDIALRGSFRNRIHWQSDSELCFEQESSLVFVDVDEEPVREPKSTCKVETLARLGTSSISFLPNRRFVFVADKDTGASLCYRSVQREGIYRVKLLAT